MEVAYIGEISLFISSTWGIQGSFPSLYCPFLKIKIGSPLFPVLDQGFGITLLFTVEPNLKLCPHLPSLIISPSKGCILLIFNFSLKVLPKSISVPPSVTLLIVPASVCW